MRIGLVGNQQNINSKAKLSLIAEKNLLPKNTANILKQKAESVGSHADIIGISIMNKVVSNSNISSGVNRETLISILSVFQSNHHIETVDDVIQGSHKERQKKTFSFISDYIDNLKEQFENK